MRLILRDEFWFVYITFGSMVKFHSLVQFPVHHFHHSFVSRLLFHLLDTFTYYVINRFVFVNTLSSTVAILLCIIDFDLNMIGLGVVFCCN